MSELVITQGYAALLDEADYPWASAVAWHAHVDHSRVYVSRNVPGANGRRKLFLHNEVWYRHCGAVPGGLKVDHIDRNGLNNRLENLRLATPSQNQWNRGPTKDNKTGYKGVSANHNQWVAKIRIAGKQVYLGSFASAELAAQAYDEAALKVQGRFAYTNFPL